MRLLADFNARMNRLLEYGVIVIFGIMTTVIFLQVIFRYGLEQSLSWSEELARYLFIWLTFLGASVAIREGTHIRVTLAVDAIKHRATNLSLSLTANLLGIAFLYILMTKGVTVAMRVLALEQISPTMEFLPIGVIYLAIPIGCFFMILNLLEQSYRQCTDLVHAR
ncbi:MAG: TRAP transporter small permease [Rhodospirillales bacterium]|nr:TRAP transporter small permease [Rhodospirillales bacterium]